MARVRWIGLVSALTLAGAGALYRWQPLRWHLRPRPLPDSNPWTDPDSRRLLRPGARVLLVTAHPDDSEFFLGGTVTRLGDIGAETILVVTTDGAKGYYPFVDPGPLRQTRREEQSQAASLWRAKEVVYLGYKDGRLELTAELVARLTREIVRLQPEYVISFDGDHPTRITHQDHTVTGLAVREALWEARSPAWLLQFATRAPNFALDVTAQRHRKLDLLRVHRSQFYDEKLRVAARVVARTARSHGHILGVRYAEAFRCTRGVE